MQKEIDISIIIVHYKNFNDTFQCIKSIYEHEKDLCFEIILVDNSPETNDREKLQLEFPEIIYLSPGKNVGFGRANNIGYQHAKGNYVLLLNNDTLLKDDAISKAITSYKKNKVSGLMTCSIQSNFGGVNQFSAFNEYPRLKNYLTENFLFILLTRHRVNYKNLKYEKLTQLNQQSGKVKWISGAFMLFKKDIIKTDKLFDEDYFMYSEDVNLCYNLSKNGLTHYIEADVKIMHANGASFKQKEFRDQQIMASELLFIRKNYGIVYFITSVVILKINYLSDVLIAFLRKTTIPQIKKSYNKAISKSFIKILFFTFRKNDESYLKVYK